MIESPSSCEASLSRQARNRVDFSQAGFAFAKCLRRALPSVRSLYLAGVHSFETINGIQKLAPRT
jgi:hypothetical protein